MTRIMIIRHAEKPGDADPDRGVTEDGIHCAHDLTVRGWQRAGALVPFFTAPPPGLDVPASIFASAAVPESPSRRAMHTVKPLARRLGLHIDHTHPEGDEAALAAAVLAAPSPVLIAWHHSSIIPLVRMIAGEVPGCPQHWPGRRFDVVWVLDRGGDGSWQLSQVAQCLLSHDRSETITAPD